MSVWEDADFWFAITMESKHDWSKKYINSKFYVPMLIDGQDDAMIAYRLGDVMKPYNWRFIIPKKMVFMVEFREHTTWKPNPSRAYNGMNVKVVTHSIREKNLVIDKRSSLEEVEELLCILKLMMS